MSVFALPFLSSPALSSASLAGADRVIGPAQADWHRSFLVGRLVALAVAFSAAPFFLIQPATSIEALPPMAACLAANVAGLAFLSLGRRDTIAVAASAGGCLALGLGLWTGLGVVAVAAAALAVVLDVIALPARAGRFRLLPGFLVVASLLAMASLAPVSGALQGAVAVALLPLAALITAGLEFRAMGRRLATIAASAEEVAARERSLMAATQAGVVLVERGGHVIDATPHAAAVLGADLRDIFGRGLVERVLIADRPALLKMISEAAIDRRTGFLTLRLADNAAGAVQSYRLFRLDIAPAASGADHASIRMTQAAFADSMPVVDRAALFQTLSHEVRTPMNAILGFSEMLANPALQPQEREKISEYANIINASARDSFAVMRALVDLLRVESTKFEADESLDIEEMLRAVLSQCQSRDADQTLAVSVRGQAGPADADPRALRMLLTALTEGLISACGSPCDVDCAFSRTTSGPALTIVVRGTAGSTGQKDAYVGVVQELAHRLASSIGAELVISPVEAGWRSNLVFRGAGFVVSRMMTAEPTPFAPLPIRKSA